MYVHLGDDCLVACADIVAIINVASLTDDAAAAHFVAQARENGLLRHVSPDEVLSYVVTDAAVYASPVRAATLQKRVHHPFG